MGLTPSRIVTQRLVLEPVPVDVAAGVVAGDLTGVTAGEGWPHDDTVDGLRGAVTGGAAVWFVTLDGVVIGDGGTHGAPDQDGEVELGYGLAAPYRGSGYGSELVIALSSWLLEQDAVLRVVAHDVDADNLPSRRALLRAGFVEEPGGRDHFSYALVR